MGNPSTLGIGTDVKWTIPAEIASRTDINQVRVWRSGKENSDYTILATVPYSTATPWHHDATGQRSMFYLVTFCNITLPDTVVFESYWHTTFFPALPHEAKLVRQIRSATPAIIDKMMTDEDYLSGLSLAVQIFNAYPPETYFRLSSFPYQYEAFLIGLAQLTTLASRFLPLSIRDWRYSEPGGVAMDIDRGAKMQAAMDVIAKVYTQYLPLIKLDFASDLPMGLGTVQLPMSMGGVVSRGLLNVLDIFTATGR